MQERGRGRGKQREKKGRDEQLEEDGLAEKDLSGLCAEVPDLVLLELDGLAWSMSSD